MYAYKQIVVGVDLHPEDDNFVLERALQLATLNKATLNIVHAVEDLIYAYAGVQASPLILEVRENMLARAKKHVSDLCKRAGDLNVQQFVEVGLPKQVILDTAQKVQADLIIVGSHGKHGLSLLLGATANAVLHHATCDVLAVRIKGK